MRKQIIEALNSTNKPMSFGEIADVIKLNKDAYVLNAELNVLTQLGVIQTIYKEFGGCLYTIRD